MTEWPEGVGRVILESTDSTNAEAARRAASGERGPLWILALRQTRARARRGRQWSTGEGNLAATFLFQPKSPPSLAALHSFAASLAVADLFDRLLPRAEIALKWPNDVLIGGRKAAGILLESAGRADALDWLAIGIGINVVSRPEALDIRPGGAHPTSLVEEGAAPVSPDQALALLAPALARHIAILRAEGFAPVRERWLARAAYRGRTIGAGLATEQLSGLFEDIDMEGNLLLATADGRRRIAAADIFFPEEA